jgi:putative membrane protein insertion efficiency factor
MIANRDGRTDPVARSLPSVPETGPTVITRALMAVVTGYRRFISPLLPPRCRFEPSCSAYALTSLREHGAVRGLWLAVTRIARCHPFHPGGYDPVPPRGTRRKPSRTKAGPLSTETQGS